MNIIDSAEYYTTGCILDDNLNLVDLPNDYLGENWEFLAETYRFVEEN